MNRFLVLGCVALLGLTGCASGGKLEPDAWFRTEPAAAASVDGLPLQEYQLEIREQLATPDCTTEPARATTQAEAQRVLTHLIKCTEVEKDIEKRVEKRNDLVGNLIMASNANCNVYLLGLRGGQITSRMIADTLSTSAGVFGALFKPAGTLRAMAAISGWSTAFGASVDRNIFAMQSAELAADSIKQLRADDRKQLDLKQTWSYPQWPVGEAVADTLDYHADCSMLRGLTRLHDALSTREAAVQATRKALLALAAGDVHGQPLETVIQNLDAAATLPEPAPQAAADNAALQITEAKDLQTALDKVKACVTDYRAAIKEDTKTKDQILMAVDASCKPATQWWAPLFTDAYGKFDANVVMTIVDGVAANATKAAKDAAKAAGDAAEAAANSAAAEDTATISAARSGARTGTIDLAQANASAQAVADLLQGYSKARGDKDPMLTAMLTAARGAVTDDHKGDAGSAKVASQVAIEAGAYYAAKCDYLGACVS